MVRDKFNRIPYDNTLTCELCGGSSCRYDLDFQCNICRRCTQDHMTAVDQIMAGRAGVTPLFDIPTEIIEGQIFLGPHHSSVSDEYFDSANIKQILVCCTHLQQYHNRNNKYRYHRIPIHDSVAEELSPTFLKNACDFIDQGIAQNAATLIHCHAGVSRSASITIAWLMRSKRWTFDQAYDYVKQRRKIICPNSGFIRQLKEWEKTIL